MNRFTISKIFIAMVFSLNCYTLTFKFIKNQEEKISIHQNLLSEVIEDTLRQSKLPSNDRKLYSSFTSNDLDSSINRICEPYHFNNMNKNNFTDLISRTGCCSPSDVRHIYNAMIKDEKLVLFKRSATGKVFTLPPVTSVKKMERDNFNIPIISEDLRKNENLPCKYYFNGTLHVIGKSTIHNVYHAGNSFISKVFFN